MTAITFPNTATYVEHLRENLLVEFYLGAENGAPFVGARIRVLTRHADGTVDQNLPVEDLRMSYSSTMDPTNRIADPVVVQDA